MFAKFATKQNLRMVPEKSASIVNSKSVRGAEFKLLFLEQNR